MPLPRLRRDRTALLVIDVQERLLPTIHGGAAVAHNCAVLMDIAEALALPTIVTEQYVKGLGHSDAAIRARIDARASSPSAITLIEKTRFSAAVKPTLDELDRRSIGTVLVCGIEAHVCVLQTTLDLLAAGRQVFLATDAISSGQRDQIPIAFERLRSSGAILTGVLGATYELLGDAQDPAFRACLGLVKSLRTLPEAR